MIRPLIGVILYSAALAIGMAVLLVGLLRRLAPPE